MRFEYPTDVCFNCSRCGLCCGDTQQKKRHVLLLKSDAERIAVQTKQEIESFAAEIADKAPYVYEMHKRSSDGKCLFLKDNECTVYGVRPLICRFYPFELSTKEEGVFVFRVTDECPEVSCQGNKAVGKKRDAGFFRALLELACAELQFRSR